MRFELADHGAAAQPSEHEQAKTDGAKPGGDLHFRHAGIVFQDIIHEEAENARLRRDVKKLGADAEREMFAPEQIPVLGNQQEPGDIGGH